jgi:hypothetical protein
MGMKYQISLVVALGLAGASAQGQTLDQSSPNTNATFNMAASSLNWQQEVAVGRSGPLVRVDLYVVQPGSCTFYLISGAPWQGGTAAYTTTFSSAATGWVSLNTTASGLAFNPGDHFVLGFIGTDNAVWLGGSGQTPPSGGYAPGQLLLNGAVHADGTWDVAFKTYVPAPGVVALGAAGMLGGLARRRR